MRAFVLAAAALTLACASSPPALRLAAKASPEEVAVIDARTRSEPPSSSYVTVKVLTVTVDNPSSENDVIQRLRAEAAALGADAVIVRQVRSFMSGGVGGADTPPRMSGTGLAIHYPAGPPK